MSAAETIATASLLIASLSFTVSIVAIRRDRAVLKVRILNREETSYLEVDNVGLRPVRIVKVLRCRHRLLPWRIEDLTRSAGSSLGLAGLPIVLAPAGRETLALREDVLSSPGYLILEDAAGRRHGVGVS